MDDGGRSNYLVNIWRAVATGLNITEEDWNSSVKQLAATLDKFKVPEREKNEVLGAVSGLKGDIVGR